MPESIHIDDGVAHIGGVSFSVWASARGLELGGNAVLRPVPFGLRGRLVAWSGCDLPEALLAATLDGTADSLEPLALQGLALHLAGAGSGAPGFATSAALVARLLGWSLADINAAEALEIDGLATSLLPSVEQVNDSDWTTVLFTAKAETSAGDETLESICARLTVDLQHRSGKAINSAEAALLSAAPPAAGNLAPTDQLARAVWGIGEAGTVNSAALHTLTAQVSGTAVNVDPSSNSWSMRESSDSQKSDVAAIPFSSTPAVRFRQQLCERYLETAVEAQPELDGSPAQEHQSELKSEFEWQGRSNRVADLEVADSNRLGALLSHTEPARPDSRSAVDASGHVAPPASALPYSLNAANASMAATATAIVHESVPPRSNPYWQAVSPLDQTRSLADTANGQPAHSMPMAVTPTTTEPVTDLDAIADALHAIADLRGVAR